MERTPWYKFEIPAQWKKENREPHFWLKFFIRFLVFSFVSFWVHYLTA